MDKKTYSLTIYLIKESLTQGIVVTGLNEKEIPGIGKLYYKNSYQNFPKWLKLFEQYHINNLFSSSASAVLLMLVENRFFAVTFGPAARHFLASGVWEERFGLIVTLNSVKKDSIRSIDTRTLESDGIQTRIQSAKPLSADNFGINVEKDLVRSVTGESKDFVKFGKGLSGKDSLRVTLECGLENLKNYLKNYLEQFKKVDYKNEFPWIDALREINDISKITQLNNKLIEEINKNNPNKLWLTIPDILDWTDHGGFKYSRRKKGDLLDDIRINTYKEYINCIPLQLNHLIENNIYRFSQSNEYQKDQWSVYECLYFEYSEGDETCFLTDGKWYAVKNNLVKTVKDYFNGISTDLQRITFIDYNHEDEGEYNQELASRNDAFLVDERLIQIEGRSTFEFCDVFTKKKQLIHIKKYSRSSVLSHLFDQGYVSANFLMDKDFREKINNKLTSSFKITDTSIRPNQTNGEYAVIFGIISKFDSALEIPFFSKLTLMHVCKSLINLGFQVSLVKIKNLKPDKKEEG